MGTLLVKNADTIVTCDDADHVFTHADLLATDGVITYVGPTGANAAAAPSPADEVIDARGKVVYPGLVNTHHHFYQIFTRNYPEVQNLELFPWLTTLYEYWKNIDPEVMRYATYSALGELVKGGCTTCFDHHYVFPNGVDGLMEAEFDAASQIGTRMVVSRGSMSACRPIPWSRAWTPFFPTLSARSRSSTTRRRSRCGRWCWRRARRSPSPRICW